MRGDIRGRWTTRDAHLLAALFSSMRYVMKAVVDKGKVPPPGSAAAPLPPLLADMKRHLLAHDALLFAEPADPKALRGGWYDRNGNHRPDAADELLIDIFVPGTDRRVFDFSTAEFVRGRVAAGGAAHAVGQPAPGAMRLSEVPLRRPRDRLGGGLHRRNGVLSGWHRRSPSRCS